MRLVEKGLQLAKDTLPLSAWDSLQNARLENNQQSYLNCEHRTQLRFGSEIVDWEHLGEKYIEGVGTLRRMGITSAEGYSYATLVGIPEKPESLVPVIGTSAWTTSTEGHNEHTVRNMMRAGNFVFFVGGEGSYKPPVKSKALLPISLAGSAAVVLNFSYHAGQELLSEGYSIDTQARTVIGESRGGMVGMGIIALASEFEQTVDYADLTAPCLPRKMTLQDTSKLTEQLVKEPVEIAKLLGSLTIGRLIHYPATFDLSLYSLKHQFAIGFALFSGEAGALARHIPEKSLIHITTFSGDFASMKHEWEEIFKNHPNIRITSLPGSHLTLADLETLKYIIGRNKAAQICKSEQEDLTLTSVFDAAHLFAPEQKPLLKRAS